MSLSPWVGSPVSLGPEDLGPGPKAKEPKGPKLKTDKTQNIGGPALDPLMPKPWPGTVVSPGVQLNGPMRSLGFRVSKDA